MFIITFRMNATAPCYYLRGTAWTAERTRAAMYLTIGDAKNAIEKSKMFNPRAAKKAVIIHIDGE